MSFYSCISGSLLLQTPSYDRIFLEMEIACCRSGQSSPTTANLCNQKQSYDLRQFQRRRCPRDRKIYVSSYGQPIFKLARRRHSVYNIPTESLALNLLPQCHVPFPIIHRPENGFWTRWPYAKADRFAVFGKSPLELPSRSNIDGLFPVQAEQQICHFCFEG
jgi:hypothetical protein